ncbi:TspA protein [Neisseria sp. N95_16]|uniref:TspA protein n=1 Tax=Neisseria brasiliensis TaxID=2666100 RepID=A0A7X2KXI1_9NEIS|nr:MULTISPECIES: FimV/HubP family polar landmark protein [Neisseria]MRN37651.1 TspA protein [Neisseria brasiliensis]PJO10302.1 TspA protein [Neisseria sp. N95_16]
MKNHHKIKLIVASVALMTSFSAMAGLGGLNVHSHLGEPFSGTITVTGDEAKALLNGGKASISNGNLRASIRKSGGDKAVVNIRSSKPIQDPVLIFQVSVGSQSREYTAIIDPTGYNSKTDSAATRVHKNNQVNRVEAAPAATSVDRQAARERINRAIGSNNTPAARNDKPVRRAANDTKAAKPKPQQQYSGIVYGKRHLVRQGETLTGIASRVRPQGMTLAQTVQALVNANPDVFINNDADRMLAGKILSIPNRGEFQNYANQAAPAAKPVENQPATATPTEAPAETPAATTTTPATTAEPTVPAADQAASQAEPAVAAASQAVDNAAAIAASEPAVASEASAVEPVAPAVTEPASPQEEVTDSSDNSLWRWLLLGGAALIALFFLSKLLGKRKAEPAAESVQPVAKEETFTPEAYTTAYKPLSESEQPVSNAAKTAATVAGVSAAATAAAAYVAKKPDDELEVEDDFGDDIFFTEVQEAPVAKQGDVDVDLNAIDTAQAAIVSGAVTLDEETEKRRNADWDSIESTESVYEPEPENLYASAEAVVIEEPAAPVADAFVTEQPSERESWDFEVEEAKTEVKEKEWDFFAEDAKVETESTDSNLATVGTAALVAAGAAAGAKALATEADKADDEAPLEFVQPEVEPEPVIDATFEPSPELRDEAVETEMAAEPELFDIQQAEALSFQDAEEFNVEVAQVADADEAIEWDSISLADTADSSRRESGFISESVGMTAPLEAKYELAKMYVEIGDPEAARETLQELLEESDGAILAKAKAMLEELNA